MLTERLSWLRPDPREKRTASVMMLVAANLVHLCGVLGLHWQVFPILLVFWMENVVIGAFNDGVRSRRNKQCVSDGSFSKMFKKETNEGGGGNE